VLPVSGAPSDWRDCRGAQISDVSEACDCWGVHRLGDLGEVRTDEDYSILYQAPNLCQVQL
jgi:hypothetical protein